MARGNILQMLLVGLCASADMGCATDPRSVSPHLTIEPGFATVRVSLADGLATKLLALRITDWARAEVVLVNGADGTPAATAFVVPSTDPVTLTRSAVCEFDRVSPGTDYNLVVNLQNPGANGSWITVGTKSLQHIAVAPGINEFPLGLIDAIQPSQVTGTAALGKYMYSLPAPGPSSRLADLTDLAVDSKGVVYALDGAYLRRLAMGADGRPSLATLAGGAGYVDGTAQLARFQSPRSLLLADDNHLLILEQGGFLREVAIDGQSQLTVRTVTGSGVQGFQDGDGATAQFDTISQIARGPDGSIYVADTGNRRIRRLVLTQGGGATVSTIAGGSTAGWVDGPGSTARFASPSGLAVDATGTIFVSDKDRIRRITMDATGQATVSTLTGGATPGSDDGSLQQATFEGPQGLAFDQSGHLFVAETNGRRLRMITFSTGGGQVSTIVKSQISTNTDGPASIASLRDPIRVAVAHTGSLFIAENTGARIRRLDFVAPEARLVTVAGDGSRSDQRDGPAPDSKFSSIEGLAEDGKGNVFVADWGGARIWKVSAQGDVTAFAGDGSAGLVNGGAAQARFNQPTVGAVGPDGSLYIGEEGNHVIRKITVDSAGAATVSTFAGSGAIGSQDGAPQVASFINPAWMAFDLDGNLLVTDNRANTVRKVTIDHGTPTLVSTIAGQAGVGFVDGPAARAKFNNPDGIVIDAAGRILVADGKNCRVRMILRDSAGMYFVSTLAGSVSGFEDGPGPTAKFGILGAISVVSPGVLLVGDQTNSRVRKVLYDDQGNAEVGTFAGSGPGFIDGPIATAKLSSGTYFDVKVSSNGTIYISDQANNCIRVIK